MSVGKELWSGSPGPSDAPALIDAASGATLSYRELLERAAGAAQLMGVARGLVFLLCRNDVSTLVHYAAALLGGHVVALVDSEQEPEVLRALVGAYEPTCIAGASGTAARIGGDHLVFESVTATPGGEIVRTSYRDAELHPDLSMLLSTSGTTGSRKFVRLSARNVQSNAASIAECLSLTQDERPITALPIHYTFGLSVVNSHWQAGAAVVVTTDSFVQPSFWEAFRSHGCTSFAGVPFSYEVLERIGFRQMELPSLTSLQQAGGALDERLTREYSRFMEARGGRFFVMYGQTEATARMAYVPPARLRAKIGSAGIPVPSGRLEIEPAGETSPRGTAVGEVVYAGPNVMLGYATGRADLARGDELDGVLRTGDIGYLDKDGFLFLVGRKKRIAKAFGHRVNLDEIESLLVAAGPAGAIDGTDAIWVYCAFGSDESVTAAGDALARRLRLHRAAVVMRRVDTLPRAPSGKIDYQQLRQWLRDSEGASAGDDPSRSR